MSSHRRMSCRSPITCKYLRYRLPDDHTILLPLIEIELVSETESLTTIGLLDSGANRTFIPYEIADILEMIPEERQSEDVATAGGSAPFVRAKLKRLSLLASGKIFSDFHTLRVLIPSPEKDLPYVILGRDSVFERFHITFKEKINKFVIEHHKWAIKGDKYRDSKSGRSGLRH